MSWRCSDRDPVLRAAPPRAAVELTETPGPQQRLFSAASVMFMLLARSDSKPIE